MYTYCVVCVHDRLRCAVHVLCIDRRTYCMHQYTTVEYTVCVHARLLFLSVHAAYGVCIGHAVVNYTTSRRSSLHVDTALQLNHYCIIW